MPSVYNISKMTTPALVICLFVSLFTCSVGAQEDGIAVITAGEVLVLDCSANDPDGGVEHDVVWFLDDVQVSNASELYLTNLNQTHHGSKVTCHNGTAIVHTRIIHFHHETAFAVGSTLTLNCTTYPAPSNNVTWHQSNKAATSDWVIRNPDNITSQLMIQNVTLEDAGLYSCLSSEGVTFKVYNISVGFFPRMPSSFNCYGCSEFELTCEWSQIPDTHLPTEVTFEYFSVLFSTDWTACQVQMNTACHISSGEKLKFRLTISNALETISDEFDYSYTPYRELTIPAPHIIGIQPLSSDRLGVNWTLSLCSAKDTYGTNEFNYQMEYWDNYTNTTTKEYITRMDYRDVSLGYANTEYCFRMKAKTTFSKYGDWSDWKCNRTLPTVPNVDFERTDFTNVMSEKGMDQRDVKLTWKLKVDETDNQPFQGISHFELEVKQSKMASNEIDRNSTSHSSLLFIYDLEGQSDYSLVLDNFSYIIPGLKKNEKYTISLSAVNSAGGTKTSFIVNRWEDTPSASTTGIIAGICVPLVIFLILALLAFGFQRLKNNSQPIPEPVFRGVGDVKPTHVEHEVFDELPAMAKERQRQLLVSISRESEESQPEGKGYRMSSSSSSGVGTDTSSLENGPVEKVPLLETRNISGSINRSPYSLLSELTPSTPNLRMALDAVETDLDSLLPVGGHYSSTDEGMSMGGSSCYQLRSLADGSLPNPYYSMCAQVPVRIIKPGNDPGYQQCVDDRDDERLLPSTDADDEASQPSTPATPNCPYYSYLSSHNDAARRDQSQDYCDPYVKAASMPSSPPLQLQSKNLATIEETPSNSVPQAAQRVLNGPNNSQVPYNSGYVDSTDICTGRPIGMPDDNSDSEPSSLQSSPEHAVIIHKNPRGHSDPSSENIDDTYVISPSSTPLKSFPSQTIINTSAPPSNGYVVSPSNSSLNSSSIRPKGSSGYVTHEQLPLVQRPPLVEDSWQASEQPSQSPAHVSASMPTLSTSTSGYVPIAQMPIPAQSAYTPKDTPAQTHALETSSDSSDLSMLMPQSLPAADLSSKTSDIECKPLIDNHEQESQSGNPPLDQIPTPMLESVQESPLLNKDKGPVASESSAATHASPNRQGTLPCVDGGYVSKDMTSFPCKTKPIVPLQTE